MTEIPIVERGSNASVSHMLRKEQGDSEPENVLHGFCGQELQQTTLPDRIERKRHMNYKRAIEKGGDRRI
jgi:hypothetical protein